MKIDDAGTHVQLFNLDTWMKEETDAALDVFRNAKEKGAP